MATSNMNLTLPTVSETEGPDWAELINALILLIDAHDHSSGKGVKVTPSGMNINATLDFANNILSSLKYLGLQSQSSVTAAGSLYRVGDNLYYNNAAGVAVQITSGTSVNSSGSGALTVSTPGSYPYTVTSGDAQKILLVATTAARTINLPAATTAMFFMVKDKNLASATYNITVVPDGTDTIDGVNDDFIIDYNGACVGFVSDGTSAWYAV